MSSDKYPLPNDPAARAVREARARFDALKPRPIGQMLGEILQERTLAQHVSDVADKRSVGQMVDELMEHTLQRPSVSHLPITAAADLAPLIRASRKRMKMSQQQFADACGVGRRFLSELENGKASLEFDKVLACALGAGIDLSAKPRIPL